MIDAITNLNNYLLRNYSYALNVNRSIKRHCLLTMSTACW